MKKVNWVLSAALFATSTVGFAVGLEYEGRDYNTAATVAAQREAIQNSRGPSWLIYKEAKGGNKAVGQIILSADSVGSTLNVTVQGTDNQVETHQVKYLTSDRALEAAKNLTSAVSTGTGLSLDVSACVNDKFETSKTEIITTKSGETRQCVRIFSSHTMACSDATLTPTPQRLVRQAELEEGVMSSEVVCPSTRRPLQFRE